MVVSQRVGLDTGRSVFGVAEIAILLRPGGASRPRIGALRQLGGIERPGRRHEQQKQGALALVFRFRTGLFRGAHDGLAGPVTDPPFPSRPAALREDDLQHHSLSITGSNLVSHDGDNIF